MTEAKNIYEAINNVMSQIGYVQKGGKMLTGQRYTYAKESDFIRAVRPLLVENGIVVHPAGISQINQDNVTTSKGTVMQRDTAVFNFRWYHAPSETHMLSTVFGQGADTLDKSANKAMTAALKYTLRQTLLIETGDDPDDTPSGDGVEVMPTEVQTKGFHAAGNRKYGDGWDDKRPELIEAVTKGRGRKTADLTANEMATLTRGMQS